MNSSINSEECTKSIRTLLHELFPIHRTLVNEGYNKSLDILKRQLPFEVHKYPSGKPVYDWIIPNSWNVKKAYIKNKNADTLVDFGNNNLHLSAYSIPFNGIVSHNDLLNHLNFREDLPEAIPYNFHYYKKHWSFNVSFNEFKKRFVEDEYEVCIEVDEYPDFLQVGELFIKGASEEEVWITSYMCHPSMVNDNLSGVLTVVELAKLLMEQKDLRFSYRLLIVPETIGAIAYLAANERLFSKVKAGFTAYCCGDAGILHYKKSYAGNHYIDRVFHYALQFFNGPDNFRMLDFWPGGSDERQFNGTGIRLPMASVTRTPAAVFKEYHTSLDNLDLIKPSDIADTVAQLWRVVQIMEIDLVYTPTYKGEPCFSRHQIAYPKFSDALKRSSAYNVKILSNEVDGNNSLLDIAMKWNVDVFLLADLAEQFLKEKLFTIKK